MAHGREDRAGNVGLADVACREGNTHKRLLPQRHLRLAARHLPSLATEQIGNDRVAR